MTEALRYNDTKPELHRVMDFGSALEKVAKVMEMGAIKYEDGNWLQGGKPDAEYLDSALRHILAFQDLGQEEYDTDSGCHHLAHAAWNMLALLRLNRDGAPDLAYGFDFDAYVDRWAE